MSNPESTLQQRLAEIVGAAADPFAKVASADPQLDAIAEATFEQAEETPEAPELLQPVEATTEEQPVEAVAKEASVADMAVRDIVTNEHFQAGFRNTYAQRAGEIEDAIEKIAFISAAVKRSFRRGVGSRAPLVGAGIGAAANTYRTHRQNQMNPEQPKRSLLGGALLGAAAGGAAGATVGTGLDMQRRASLLEKAKKVRAERGAKAAKAAKAADKAATRGRRMKAVGDFFKGIPGKVKRFPGKVDRAVQGAQVLGDEAMMALPSRPKRTPAPAATSQGPFKPGQGVGGQVKQKREQLLLPFGQTKQRDRGLRSIMPQFRATVSDPATPSRKGVFLGGPRPVRASRPGTTYKATSPPLKGTQGELFPNPK